ncbi:Putative Glycosyltransferase Family 4 [Podospora comata]|uniref:Alpha-1,3/1,6-mannosyltransferase ALG2 n=1 Tax=Podospora comata TaxID=48703 RepID=A0ABY6SHA9_PODCO|nr:Putative Glycosyltransferase Family 4 [Podospora comata]
MAKGTKDETGDGKVGEKKQKTIVFLHPDLGIGGAERLVVDAAVGLQKRGCKVVIFTSHCDPGHCFDEARDGTLDVRVRGNTVIPPSILGRFSILCAILRQIHLILSITLFTSELSKIDPSGFFIDQLSAGVPLLSLLRPQTPIFFYCHFPDLLLVQNRNSSLFKRLYRIPFDALEQWSMGFATSTAVNSNFTKSVVAKTWPGYPADQLKIVYPCINTSLPSSSSPDEETQPIKWGQSEKSIILSINRFERKKNIALAIQAFALLPAPARQKSKLVVAGGYDARVHENVSYHTDLVSLCEKLGLKSATVKTVVSALNSSIEDVDVLFLLSVPNALKEILLKSAKLLVYTPREEHFGIVPLEAMLRGVPVLAADSGGPLETVVEGRTGWLRAGKPELWREVMERVVERMEEGELREMGEEGKKRVRENFAETEMARQLEGVFEEMEGVDAKGAGALGLVLVVMAGITGAIGVGIGLWLVRTPAVKL